MLYVIFGHVQNAVEASTELRKHFKKKQHLNWFLKKSIRVRQNSIINTEKITTIKIIVTDNMSKCLPCARNGSKSFTGINSPKLQHQPLSSTFGAITWLDSYSSLAADFSAAEHAFWFILAEKLKWRFRANTIHTLQLFSRWWKPKSSPWSTRPFFI